MGIVSEFMTYYTSKSDEELKEFISSGEYRVCKKEECVHCGFYENWVFTIDEEDFYERCLSIERETMIEKIIK